MRYGVLGILLESSNYALSNDVIEKLCFLTSLTALSTGTGFYITSLTYSGEGFLRVLLDCEAYVGHN